MAESKLLDVEGMAGGVVATHVPFEDYWDHYAEYACEWVDGTLIKLSVDARHCEVYQYVRLLLDVYFDLNRIGRTLGIPFVMRLSAIDSVREPDIQIILNTSEGRLHNTYMDGPADICIEIVWEESVTRDHNDKLMEYEKAGVPAYWIIDPAQQDVRFFRLNDTGVYDRHHEDADGNYSTPALPGFKLHIPTLWQDELPGPGATVKAVRAMFGE